MEHIFHNVDGSGFLWLARHVYNPMLYQTGLSQKPWLFGMEFVSRPKRVFRLDDTLPSTTLRVDQLDTFADILNGLVRYNDILMFDQVDGEDGSLLKFGRVHGLPSIAFRGDFILFSVPETEKIAMALKLLVRGWGYTEC